MRHLLTNIEGIHMNNYLNQFQKLKEKKFTSSDELLNFFDSLPSISLEEIWGKWKGDVFDGPWNVESLQQINWFGKWFKSNLNAIPAICFNEHNELFSNQLMKGEATMWDVTFRAKTSATMIYDHLPLFDHFRKIDKNTVMGIMSGKPFEGAPNFILEGGYNFFYLERISEFPAKYIS